MAATAKPKIAVIGAGVSGLTAIKCCKEEALDVVCFEKTDTHGGSKNYRNGHFIEGVGSIRKSTISLYSKEMNAFSDYPPPKNAPNYMNQEQMMDYIDEYAEHFDLLPHIRFKTEIISVKESSRDSLQKWTVSYQSSGNINEEEFDGVIVCSGKKSFPKELLFPGQETYAGKVMHCGRLKSVSEFENASVLVVGFGNSAVDAAVEISSIAKQVYLSTRSGGWVVPRVGKKGVPTDLLFFRRSLHTLKNLSYKRFCQYIENSINHTFNHDVYRIRPSHNVLAKHPVINDDLADKILTARVIIKGNIKNFEKDGVVFENEEDVTRTDVVIFATGYKKQFPFSNTFLQDYSCHDSRAYKFVFPTTPKRQSLALVGYIHPLGPCIPIYESQSRWVSMIFSKKLTLPTRKFMMEDITKYNETMSDRFIDDGASSWPQVDYIDYVDDLAKLCGFWPNVSSNFGSDPSLHWKCLSGPCLPYQYRLYGPNAWHEARQAIMNWEERVQFPFRGKSSKSEKCSKGQSFGWLSNSFLRVLIGLALTILRSN